MIVLEIIGALIGGLLGLLILYLLFTVIASLFISLKKEYASDSRFFRALYDSWVFIALLFCRVKVKTKGFEKIPEGRILIIANHRSNFDPIVIYRVLPGRQLAFISKPSNISIPFFGRIAWRTGCLPINREKAREAVRTINEAAKRLKEDRFSYGIYPEGTRNKTEETLLPFKAGAFKIAQFAEVPIVVMVERRTAEVKKNWPWKRTVVELEVLEVISKEEVLTIHSTELSLRVEQEMRESLETDSLKPESLEADSLKPESAGDASPDEKRSLP